MFICLCVCLCVCVFVCVFVGCCVVVCCYVFMCVAVCCCVLLCVYSCVFVCVCVCVLLCVCVFACVCVCLFVGVRGCVHVAGTPLHASHHSFTHEGVNVCTACGYMVAVSVKELANPCLCFSTPARRSNLRRMMTGTLPYVYTGWPKAEPSPPPFLVDLA